MDIEMDVIPKKIILGLPMTVTSADFSFHKVLLDQDIFLQAG